MEQHAGVKLDSEKQKAKYIPVAAIMVAKAGIAAKHGSFNRIYQVASICIPV